MLQTEAPSTGPVDKFGDWIPPGPIHKGGVYMKEELKQIIEELTPDELRLLYVVALEFKKQLK